MPEKTITYRGCQNNLVLSDVESVKLPLWAIDNWDDINRQVVSETSGEYHAVQYRPNMYEATGKISNSW